MDVNWAPSRVRRNFRIDTFSAICGGVYISVLITFMPIVVRRLGGSTIDVAIVIAAPFVGHLLSPISAIASAAGAGTILGGIPPAVGFRAAALIGPPRTAAFFLRRYEGLAKVAQRRSLVTIARDVWADHKYRRLLLSFTVFGIGNLINVAVYPILLVDHFNASNSFVGAMTAVSSATMIVAYLIWGRMIDRGSSIRLTLLNTVVTLLIPIGYIAAADVWLLIPVAIVGGIVNAGGEITFFTNIVQIAPRDKIGEYATAQSLLMGIRGTPAPFVAAALLGGADPHVVLLIGVIFMTAGCAIMAGAVRLIAAPTSVTTARVVVESPAD